MTFKELRNAVGMSEKDYVHFAALDDETEIRKLDEGSHPRQQALVEQLAKLDATMNPLLSQRSMPIPCALSEIPSLFDF